MKKLLSLVLSLVMVFSISTPAFAADSSTAYSASSASSQVYTSHYLDAEGKDNEVRITVIQSGSTHLEYYIDGVLTSTVDTTISDSNQAQITRVDAKTSRESSFTVPVSEYITPAEPADSLVASTNSYSYAGKINYKTCYDDFGNSYNYSLSIYLQAGTPTLTYRTINADQGSEASVAISVVATFLTFIYGPLAILAEDIVFAAAYAAGTSILGGIVQGVISKRYYTNLTPYDVQARDISTSRVNTYYGERYQIALEGGGYSSEYYYNGYLPWNNNSTASMIFSDFWAFAFPGVKSYS